MPQPPRDSSLVSNDAMPMEHWILYVPTADVYAYRGQRYRTAGAALQERDRQRRQHLRPLSELYAEEEARRLEQIVHDGMSQSWVYRGNHYPSREHAEEIRRQVHEEQRRRQVHAEIADQRPDWAAREEQRQRQDILAAMTVPREYLPDETGVARSAAPEEKKGGALLPVRNGGKSSRGGFLDLE